MSRKRSCRLGGDGADTQSSVALSSFILATQPQWLSRSAAYRKRLLCSAAILARLLR